jgi:xylulokinase
VIKEGRAMLYIGTAAIIGAYSPAYVVSDAFRTLIGCAPDSYNLEGGLMGGYIISWFIDKLPLPASKKTQVPLDILEEAASGVFPGADGLMTVPYWAGWSVAPYWDPWARGLTVGWSGNHGVAHFYRSVLEGVAFEYKLLLEKMAHALNVEFEDIILTGGGAKSPLWGQIISDILGIPVSLSKNIETTALGAAILAAVGVGIYSSVAEAAANMTAADNKYSPNQAIMDFYRNLYEQVYKPLFPTTQALINKLAQISSKARSKEK